MKTTEQDPARRLAGGKPRKRTRKEKIDALLYILVHVLLPLVIGIGVGYWAVKIAYLIAGG